MGQHSDPDPSAFYRSLAAAALRATLVLGAVGVVTVGIVLAAGDRDDRSPVIAFPDGVEVSPPSAGGSPDDPEGSPGSPTDLPADGRDDDLAAATPDGASPGHDATGTAPTPDPEGQEHADAKTSQADASPATRPDSTTTGTSRVAAAPAGGGASGQADQGGDTWERSTDPNRPPQPPERTSVQVLDGGAGPEATQAAAARLRELGYLVVAVNSARCCYEQTTVLWSTGYQPEAKALLGRSDAIVDVGRNPNLSEDVHLHVVVGTDWSG